MTTPTMDAATWKRENTAREKRASAERRTYQFIRQPDGAVDVFNPTSGHCYRVRRNPNSADYTCSCPDWRRNSAAGNRMDCKHIVAAHLGRHLGS